MILHHASRRNRRAMCPCPAPTSSPTYEGGCNMLWTIVVVCFGLWLLGLMTSYTLGGLIHVLLVIAVIVVLLNLIQGRRAV